MRSAPVVWALRARAPTYSMCSAPDNLCTCLLVVGMSMTSWNARCSRLSGQGVLRAPAEGEGGEGWDRHHDARACGGTLCAAAACAVRVSAARHWNGSAFPPGQAYPPHRERVCFDAVRCSGAHRCSSASSAELCDSIMPLPLRAASRERDCAVVDHALGYIACAQLAGGGRSLQVKASCRTAAMPPRAPRPPPLALDAVACWAPPQTSAARRAPRGGRGAAGEAQ